MHLNTTATVCCPKFASNLKYKIQAVKLILLGTTYQNQNKQTVGFLLSPYKDLGDTPARSCANPVSPYDLDHLQLLMGRWSMFTFLFLLNLFFN